MILPLIFSNASPKKHFSLIFLKKHGLFVSSCINGGIQSVINWSRRQIAPDTIKVKDVLTALQTLKYLGSKKKLIPFLEKTIKSVVGNDLSQMIFCDLFAGSSIVGRSFKSSVKEVISNDLEYYAYVLNRNSIGNNEPITDGQYFIDTLNRLPTNLNAPTG